ncbi:MAG: B12-binding domain-containing radical SAM protein [Deltaproteobacteria bacterium]|nr:B12-binding domain-containing radical SAM protein [Deltaproteobacteria bacterium]
MARRLNKVLFIEPRSPRPHIFSRVVIPRLGSVLLGTILEQQGMEVRVVVEEVAQPDYHTMDFRPDLVCISSISSTIPRAYELADFYRQQGLPVVMGGAHASFLPEEGLEHADFVVCGEGDEALPELVSLLRDGGDPAAIPNLCYRDGEAVYKNPWRPFLEDLDHLPLPRYDLIHGWKGGRTHCISIATSRGCPFNCRFCSVILMFGRKYRCNSVDRVMEEIRVNGLIARHIFFCDDNFTANRERIKELCERILQENLKIEWSAQVRVEAARDPELLKLMARSGCLMVFVGLESINPATLKAYNKSQSVDNIRECVVNFHHHGIKVHGMFVFGSEEDHYQVIRDTVTFSRQLDLDSLQYLILTPVPGTQVFQELEAQNRIICRDWRQYDGHFAVFQPKHFTPYELQYETIRATRKFYSWPSVLKRLLARDWFFVKLKAYARIHLWKSRWLKDSYVIQLKDQLFAQMRTWRRFLPGGKAVPRVGIPADIWTLGPWEANLRDFLLKFLHRLGVEVIQEGETAVEENGLVPALKSEIARLQEKADLVLLPFWQGLEDARNKMRELHQEISGETLPRLMALEFSRDTFYNACMQLGLCFNKRLKRLRRIYFQTLAEEGVQL